MRAADDGGLGHRIVRDQGALDLRRAQPVSRHVQYVVDAAGDPVVAVPVAPAAVTGEVHAAVRAEVGLDEALVIAVDRSGLPRPGPLQAKVAALVVPREFVAVRIHEHRLDAEEGQGRGARFKRRGARQRRDQDAAGLGLPPGVDDRATSVAHHVVVPLPDLRVDRFADRPENAQRTAVVRLDPLIAFARDRSQRRGRRVEEGHAEVVHHLPVAAGIGIRRHRLEHHARRPVGERAVDDVAVPGDPADVRGAEVDVVVVVVEDQPVRHRGVQQVAAGRVEQTLGPSRRAAGVEDEQGRLGVEPGHRRSRALLRRLLVQPEVAAWGHRHFRVGPPGDEHVLDQVETLDRLVAGRLERDRPAAAQALVRGDEQPATRVDDPLAQAVRGEPREDDGVHRADPRAGEHRVGELRDHRQVDADPVALTDPERRQDVRDAADVLLQFAVADPPVAARFVLDPDQGGLVGLRRGVAVDAVDAGVELAVLEPGEVDGVEIPAPRRPRRREPVEGRGLVEPEPVRVLDRLAVEPPVRIHAVHVGAATLRDRGFDGDHPILLRRRLNPGRTLAAPRQAPPPTRCPRSSRSSR